MDAVTLAFLGLFVLIGAAVGGMGILNIYKGYRIWSNEPIPVNEVHLSDGVVEVEGEVETVDGNTFEAKYSGEEAVVHDWKKERKKRSSRRGSSWSTQGSGEDGVPFRVSDGTGSVTIDPEEASLSLSMSTVSRSGRTRRREGRLEPGDEVHVYGQKKSLVERRDDIGDANFYVGNGDAVSDFRITDGTEFSAVARLIAVGALYAVFGVVFAGVPTGAILGGIGVI